MVEEEVIDKTRTVRKGQSTRPSMQSSSEQKEKNVNEKINRKDEGRIVANIGRFALPVSLRVAILELERYNNVRNLN